MTRILTCETCGKQEERAGRGGAKYCLACARDRVRAAQRARSRVGALTAVLKKWVQVCDDGDIDTFNAPGLLEESRRALGTKGKL